jgi:hypothetical protein
MIGEKWYEYLFTKQTLLLDTISIMGKCHNPHYFQVVRQRFFGIRVYMNKTCTFIHIWALVHKT